MALATPAVAVDVCAGGVAVRTDRGELEADWLVLAQGPWSEGDAAVLPVPVPLRCAPFCCYWCGATCDPDSMKRSLPTIAWLVLVGGLASCSGPHKPAATPQPTPCAAMAAHVGSTVPVDEGKDLIEKIMAESCERDGWSKETIDCMRTEPFKPLISGSETPFGRCNALMTAAQRDGISRRFAAEVDKARGTPEAKPKTQEMELPPAPPPPPPPKKK